MDNVKYSVAPLTWKIAIDQWANGKMLNDVGLIYHPSQISESEIQDYAFHTHGIVVTITEYNGYLKRIAYNGKLTSYSSLYEHIHS